MARKGKDRETIEKSRDDSPDGALLDDDPELWQDNAVDKSEFYAATYVCSELDPDAYVDLTATANDTESKETQGRLLDALALLFARAKKIVLRKQDIVTDPCPSSAGQNITATGMAIEQHEINGRFYRRIYIAKNDGPQDFGNFKDTDFAEKLATWYNNLSMDPLRYSTSQILPNASDQQWTRLQDFWFYRHRFYIHQIMLMQDEWRKLCIELIDDPVPGSVTHMFSEHSNDLKPSDSRRVHHDHVKCKVDLTKDDLPEPMEQLYQVTDPKQLDGLRADWDHIRKLLSWMAPYHSSILNDRSQMRNYVSKLCIEDAGEWRLSYPRRQSNAVKLPFSVCHWKRLDSIRRIIKCFTMLRHTLVVWMLLIQSHHENQSIGLEITFLERFPIKPIPVQDLVPFLERLQAASITREPEFNFVNDAGQVTREGESGAERNVSNLLKFLKSGGPIRRNFHAELQLLTLRRRGMNWWDIESYIGCSKLSCLFCWKLLEIHGFRTKNTHGKVYCGCAFPLHKWPSFDMIKVQKLITELGQYLIIKSERLYGNYTEKVEKLDYYSKSETDGPDSPDLPEWAHSDGEF